MLRLNSVLSRNCRVSAILLSARTQGTLKANAFTQKAGKQRGRRSSAGVLLGSGYRLHSGSVGGECRFRGKEGVVVEVAVHAASNLGGFGAESGTATLEDNHGHNASSVSVRVGGKPSITRACA